MSGITADGFRELKQSLERDAEARIAALKGNLAKAVPAERAGIRREIAEVRAELERRIRSLESCLF